MFDVLASDLGFTEGPVFRQSGEVAVVSMGRGHVYQVSNGDKSLFVTGGTPNGLAEGADGALYVAQNGGRGRNFKRPTMTGGIQVIRPNGMISYVTTDPVSPNDLCFGPDGLLYVTDPTRRAPRRDDARLWRIDTDNGEAELLVSVPWHANGIAFGLENDAVYVASTGDQKILRLPLTPEGLGKPELVVQMEVGYPDGFAFDTDGNFIIAAHGLYEGPGTLQVWDREGKLLDLIRPGENSAYTNVALSEDRRLILTDTDGGAVLVTDDWPTAGLPLHPFRPSGLSVSSGRAACNRSRASRDR